jgi:Glycosyltransferase family 28 N-terminal domain
MRCVLASYRTRGDVEPCAAVGRELLHRGHEVRIAVAPDLVGFVESAGLPVVANGLGTQAMLDAYRTSGCVFSATSPGTDHRSCVSIGHIRDFVETVDRPLVYYRLEGVPRISTEGMENR